MEPAKAASNEDNSSQTPQLPEDNEGGFAGWALFG